MTTRTVAFACLALVAAPLAAKDSLGLVIFGLVVSVPIIVLGSKLVLMLMDRFPIVIVAGVFFLGLLRVVVLVVRESERGSEQSEQDQ